MLTKGKVSVTLDKEVIEHLNETIDNKSKYIEYLIYKDLKENGLIEKEIIL